MMGAVHEDPSRETARDAPEDRFRQLQRHLPYGGLAVSLCLVLALGPYTARHLAPACALAAGAALWVAATEVPYPTPPDRRRRAVVGYAGLMAFFAALVVVSPFFGFFGCAGYVQVALLPRRTRIPAVVVNAALVATTQIGGVRNLHGGAVVVYLGLLVVNVVVAGALTHQGIEEDLRSRRRARLIDELADANRRLRETMRENAGLHAQLLAQVREAGVLDERQRMAGEIHDTLAQGLTGIVTQLEAAERFDADPERRARHRELARTLARESLAEARRSVQALRPGPLDEAAHLPAALGDLAERWIRASGVPVRVEVAGGPVPLPTALEVVLFRTAQEALANIAKHAGASRAGLTLTYTHEVVVLDVLDDGRGFDPAGAREGAAGDGRRDGSGYGLTAMRERLRQVGGTLAIESAPGDGTVLSAGVPAVAVAASVLASPGPGALEAAAGPSQAGPGSERLSEPSDVPAREPDGRGALARTPIMENDL